MGFHRSGKRRYLCLICGKSFSRQKHNPSFLSEFRVFQKLIVGKTNRENLLDKAAISRPTLSKRFKNFFDKNISSEDVWKLSPPKLISKKLHEPWVLGIDGKWLRRQGVLLIYRDVTHKENLFWSYHDSESYRALYDDLEKLVRLLGKGHLPSGVISDWKGSVVSATASYLPNSHHQRCLAHVLRTAKRLLPKHSPFLATLVLRNIAMALPKIKTRDDKRKWLSDLIEWERLYGYQLKERTTNHNLGISKKWWYTHGNLRRAFNLLTDDWRPFFVFLDHPLIPSTNNSLEGVNSQIKRHLTNHRGMKTFQQVSFLFWYLTFTRTKSKQDLKKLWDYWKT